MHIHRSVDGTRWPEVPFGSWRLWDARVTWADLQAAPQSWDFRRLDQYVSLAQAHDVELLLTLGMTPQWASSRPHVRVRRFELYGLGAQAPPLEMEHWRQYVRTVATRYRGRIRFYEIWDEPDQPGFYSGTPQQMVALSKAAYEILKSVDGNNVVISPSVTCEPPGLAWLRKFLAAGGASYADVIGAHFYVMPRGPEAMIAQIHGVQALMHSYNIDKPLWNTEAGWGPPNRFPSEDREAEFVIRTILLNAAAGIQRVYWYAWDNTNWVTLRLTDPVTGAPRRAAIAYAQLNQWLSGARVEQCKTEGPSNWSCAIVGASGERWRILWTTVPTADSQITIKTDKSSFPWASGRDAKSLPFRDSSCR